MRAALRDGWLRLSLSAGLAAAAEIADLGLTGAAAWLLTRASQHPGLSALAAAIVLVRALALARGVLRYGERLASHDAALRGTAALRGRLFDALRALAPASHLGGGDLVERMVRDTGAVQDATLRCLLPAATAGLVTAAVGVALTMLCGPAGLVAGAGLALAGVAPGVALLATSRRDGAAPARRALAATTLDLVQGRADLLVYGPDRAVDAATGAASELDRAERAAARHIRAAGAAGLAIQVATVALVLAAAIATGVDATLVPALALVTLAAFDVTRPLPVAAARWRELGDAAGRVEAILDEVPAVRDPDRPSAPPAGLPAVELRDVWVRHREGAPFALRGVDLRIEPGERIAIVGASGAGKSTLLAALLRMVEPERGTITLGGVDVRDLRGDDVRRVVGGLTQHDHVFHATLRENARLGRPGADDGELWDAARAVRLDGFVAGLPTGWNTLAGEGGTGLSGGQRRRLGVMRALLAAHPVLVLDEPTEGVDDDTAGAVVAAALAPDPARSVILVTHRREGLEHADTIIEMDAGRIVRRTRQAAWHAVGPCAPACSAAAS